MIPVADATGRHISPSWLAGFEALSTHRSDTPGWRIARPKLLRIHSPMQDTPVIFTDAVDETEETASASWAEAISTRKTFLPLPSKSKPWNSLCHTPSQLRWAVTFSRSLRTLTLDFGIHAGDRHSIDRHPSLSPL